MQINSKVVVRVLVILIVIALAIVVTYVQFFSSISDQKNTYTTSNTNTLETFTSSQDEGFSFSYPSNWIITSETSAEIDATKVTASSPDWEPNEQGVQFMIWKNPPGAGFEYLVNTIDSAQIYIDDMLVEKNILQDESGATTAAIIRFNRYNDSYFMKYEFTTTTNESSVMYHTILDTILNSFTWDA
jgi:hypothetical protein